MASSFSSSLSTRNGWTILLLVPLLLSPASSFLVSDAGSTRTPWFVPPPSPSPPGVRPSVAASSDDPERRTSTPPPTTTWARIALGGGCHWCTEGVFVSVHGVVRVEQGWVASTTPPDDVLSEAVIVHYDPSVIALELLLDVHLDTHASTQQHSRRHKYRSAVYWFAEEQQPGDEQRCRDHVAHRRPAVVTQVLPFASFQPSLPEHHDYYRTDPTRPFCRTYITPKLEALRQSQPAVLINDVVVVAVADEEHEASS